MHSSTVRSLNLSALMVGLVLVVIAVGQVWPW